MTFIIDTIKENEPLRKEFEKSYSEIETKREKLDNINNEIIRLFLNLTSRLVSKKIITNITLPSNRYYGNQKLAISPVGISFITDYHSNVSVKWNSLSDVFSIIKHTDDLIQYIKSQSKKDILLAFKEELEKFIQPTETPEEDKEITITFKEPKKIMFNSLKKYLIKSISLSIINSSRIEFSYEDYEDNNEIKTENYGIDNILDFMTLEQASEEVKELLGKVNLGVDKLLQNNQDCLDKLKSKLAPYLVAKEL